MLFSSLEFIFAFLPLVLLGYWALAAWGSLRWQKIWLVAASLFFYAWWRPEYLGVLVGSVLVNFGVGLAISRGQWLRPKIWLVLGIVANLLLLGYFKYAVFFSGNISALTGVGFTLEQVILPLAISFYTFQQIAYLVDVYRGKVGRVNFLDYCLFVTFFPQLIAGPIVHHSEMMPQFKARPTPDERYLNACKGLFIFSIGLFKKLAIADTFALWANAGFGAGEPLSFVDAWGTSLSYTLQLYYDFSGYTDMAIGAALLFGIKLPLNFLSPYKALSIRDFWRRWHITLSRWLRDYIYIPLGGNRAGGGRVSLNVMVTFLLGGLWHGAAWGFVLWGALHGVALVVCHFWQRLGKRLWRWAAWLLTFMFVNATWVLFRAESLADAARVYRGMLGLNGLPLGPWLGLDVLARAPAVSTSIIGGAALTCVALVLAATLWLPNSVELADYNGPAPGSGRFKPTVRNALWAALAFAVSVLLLLASVGSDFLYFNF